MSSVVPFDYQGKPVRFNSEGWINATDVAKREGRRLDKWLDTQETRDYIQALGRHLNTPEKGDLIQTQRGRAGGTWLHPKLAVAFARWLSADFAVWCDMQIDVLLHGRLDAVHRFEVAQKALEQGKQAASAHGRELAAWRWARPGMEHSVDYWQGQSQLKLDIDAP